MAASANTVYLYQDNTLDYTPYLNAINTICLVLGTLAYIGRCSARWVGEIQIGADDVLIFVGFLGLLGNIIGNYLIADSNAISLTVPTADQQAFLLKSMYSIGYTYPISVLCSKLSLLFLYRRIFGMRVMWFKVCWWIVFVIMMPIWIAMTLTFTSLNIAGNGVDTTSGIGKYSIPVTAFINAFTDLFVLVLPIGMTLNLQLNWHKRIGLMVVFTFGALGSAVSFLRAGQSVAALNQTWDPRYQLFHDAAVGLAEAAVIEICACMPVMRPLFVKFKNMTVRSFASLATRGSASNGIKSSQKASAYSLHSIERNDDGIPLRNGVIHQKFDYRVDNFSSSQLSESKR